MSTKPEESDLLASLKAALGGRGVKEAREAAEVAAPAEAGTSPGVATGAGGGPAAVVTTPVEEEASPEELQAAEERARFLSALRSCEDILNAPQPQER